MRPMGTPGDGKWRSKCHGKQTRAAAETITSPESNKSPRLLEGLNDLNSVEQISAKSEA